jgi:glucokinase
MPPGTSPTRVIMAAVALDVGGSSVKSALVSPSGRASRGSFARTPLDSRGSRTHIIQRLAGAIDHELRAAERVGWIPAGVAIAMPGPFDYRAGVSRMRHKFGAIHGLDLRARLRARLRLEPAVPIRFVHDAVAFLLGEAWRGAARGYRRAMAITLGTGVGSAVIANGRPAVTADGTPLYSLWDQPYRGGIVEDAISRAAIIARYRTLTGTGGVDVAEIARRASRERDPAARRVFAEFGEELALALRPAVARARPEALVVGGAIAKSFRLFGAPLRRELAVVPGLTKITPGTFIDLSALFGAARVVLDATPRRAAHPRRSGASATKA